MKWWKGFLAALILLVVGAITVGGMRDKAPPAVEVQLGKVKRAGISRTVTSAGKVQPATTVKISSNLSGDLTELLVKQGDVVKKGQVLGRIDRRKFEAAAKQAQAAVSAARSDVQASQVDVDRTTANYKRVEALVGKGMASQAELEVARADRDGSTARIAAVRDRAAQAVARFEESQNDLAQTTLVAPIDGTVIETSREVGERVRGSDFSEDVVMTIAALASMEVRIEVGEHEVVHLKNGQRSDVKVDALEGQTFEGAVTEVAQKATIRQPNTEAETTTFPVTVALTARPPGVLPGMNAEVKVVAESRESALVVPIQAVTVRPESQLSDRPASVEGGALQAPKKTEAFAKVVFVVDQENKARIRRVRTGISSDTDIEILEGLVEGDRIIEGPYRTLAKDLKEGDAVEESKPGDRKGPGRGPGRRG
ncbi:MAG: efflux RND transporter periplasmic adaptor subunit [Myxococcaceae bacterium]|nr:efflux RND transporter periplasmic adaptor subunit [Myxococcaceae bacterium]